MSARLSTPPPAVPAAAVAAPVSNAPRRAERDPFWDSRVCALVNLLLTVLNALPAALARRLGRTLGRLLWRLDRRHRKQVRWHLDLAFRDEKTASEKDLLCRQFFEHLGLSVIEFARLRQITRETLDQTVDASALTVFGPLLARGKGILCVSAHHGNWELCGYSAALAGYPIKSVARPLDNPQLNTMVTEIRQRSGNEIIEKWKVLWKLKKLLDKNGIVTLANDQNGGVAGLFLPFFSVAASTITSPAELHLVTGAPLVVATLNRQPDGVRHVFHVWDIIEHTRSGDHAADVRAVSQRINDAVEKAIRAYPEQWLWVHKRWKSRPPGEQPGADGLPPRIGTACAIKKM